MEIWKLILVILSDHYTLPYFLTLLAYIIHEMLGLRLVLLGAHIGYFVLAITSGHEAGIFWNSIFIIINSYHVIRILHARRIIHFGAELEAVYKDFFTDLSRNDFLRFWNLGKTGTVEHRVLVAEDHSPTALGFVIQGEVLVTKSDKLLNSLGRGRFFAEMGFLTRKPASASIVARTPVRIHRWTYAALDHAFQHNQDLKHALQGILGRDMAEKIAEQNPR